MGKAAGVPDGTILQMWRLSPRELAELAEASRRVEPDVTEEEAKRAGQKKHAAKHAVQTENVAEREEQTADAANHTDEAAGAAKTSPDSAFAVDPAVVAEAAQMDVRMVVYASRGLAVKAYLLLPEPSPARSRWPGLVYCRGGIKRVGMVYLPRLVALARRGYAVMSPVYRGNLGGEGREDFAGEDRYDASNAVLALAKLPEVIDQPIPLLGFSRGSVMALAAATMEEPVIGPVAVLGGVSDMFLTYEERVDLRRMLRRVVGHPGRDPEAYEYRSPVCWAERIRRPVFIVHGTADSQVGVQHARSLAEKLTDLGKPHAFKLYDGLGHRFPPAEEEDMLERITDWFARHGSPPRMTHPAGTERKQES